LRLSQRIPAISIEPEDNPGPKKSALEVIHPVLLSVPVNKRTLTGREKVTYLSAHARAALALSAKETGITLGELEKNGAGAPLPSNGSYWSLGHKSDYVTAVVADVPVGIDIERIKEVSEGLYKKIASDEEWNLSAENRQHLFFRYWTAKEAVLKVAGTGIRELSRCRIASVEDQQRILLDFKGEPVSVRHFFYDRHVIAVTDVGCPVEFKIVSP
jgi:4'-phosphopantetheinyl transferase